MSLTTNGHSDTYCQHIDIETRCPVPLCRFFTYWCLLFLTHQFAISLFRLTATIGRTLVVAYTLVWLIFIIVLLLDGFVLIKKSVPDWFIGGYWALPLSYVTDGLEINEFSGGEYCHAWLCHSLLLSACPYVTDGLEINEFSEGECYHAWLCHSLLLSACPF